MLAIFGIVFGAFAVFLILSLMIKKPVDPESPEPTDVRTETCGICQERFPRDEMITRTVGDAGYTRFFCDRCVTELYEESRQLHDPRYKESPPESLQVSDD